ncbi:MAG: CPBP family glutamic-type intramembrane protease [Gammaproteobacteria bacterium]
MDLIAALPLLLQKRGIVEFGLPDAWEAIGAFGPLLAAWIVIRRTRAAAGLANFWRGLVRWRVGGVGLSLALLSPVGFLLVAAALLTVATGEVPALTSGRLNNLQWMVELVLFNSVLQALGEEPGWRGYLLPALRERQRPLLATLLLFPLWWLWHLPFFLARPEFGWPQFLGFGLGILSASVWLTYLQERTGSTLMAVLWHAMLNFTRGIALAFSTSLFLTYGAVVTIGALAIVVWWLTHDQQFSRRRGSGRDRL